MSGKELADKLEEIYGRRFSGRIKVLRKNLKKIKEKKREGK